MADVATSTFCFLHHRHAAAGFELHRKQHLRYSTRLFYLSCSGWGEAGPGAGAGANRVTPFNYGVDDDHPREEYSLVGVVGDPDTASLCYLGLQKLQHHGEEGASIVNRLGLMADVIGDPSRLASFSSPATIGHVRYSTAGVAASLRNVQPFLAGYRSRQVAVAHNGNLVNYQALRSKLEARGSIFNTALDTEVILHLIATSLAWPLLARI